MISAEDMQQAIIAALAAADKVREQKAKKEAKAAAKTSAAPSSNGKDPSLPEQFLREAIKGSFGEFTAEPKEETMLVRRWNGNFWEWTWDTGGKSKAAKWLRKVAPDRSEPAAAAKCWEWLKLHLYEDSAFNRPKSVPGHIVFPMLDGYLHITKDRAWLEAPDKKLGLTFQIKARAGVALGQDFVPKPIPADSKFGKYLASSLPELDIRGLVQEQCAMSFMPNTHQSVAVWVGEGGAGKGTLAKLVEKFHHKVAAVDLHKLADPHHLEVIVDASLIRVDEIALKGMWGEKEFKAIVSGDLFVVNPKHKTNYAYSTDVYWILTTNHELLIRDESDGVHRRVVQVPWPSSTRARGGKNDGALHEAIFESESDLLLGWFVEGMQRYLRRGGPQVGNELPAKVRELMKTSRRQNNNVLEWVEECEIIPADPSLSVVHSKREIYDAYKAYTEANCGNVYSETSFWIRLKKVPGLMSSGLLSERLETLPGSTGRVKTIRNLAILPHEIARQKLRLLDEEVIARGDFKVDLALSDPFGLDPNATDGEECRIPVYNEQDLAERARLQALMTLRG
ncbi:DUF5906 domain-containing protein [Luteimonas sp. SDU101]|uniref:DUF5906 domain-containing protein n=1 Tax=Luteimonas sp. SDU101 TaxID=3422593 RepID=UPI003EB8C8B0